jgi:glycosyltransferase involved in cell wall biosynthesis
MKKILYIGGFELPDKNAAAQRVLPIGKVYRELGYDVLFCGITHSQDVEGSFADFKYEAYPYPIGTIAWFKYAFGDGIITYIQKKKPDYVILYNYPAIAQERVIRYCRRNGIKTIGDITEWYRPISFPKRIDTFLRMRYSNKHLDGIISISRFLSNYYSNCHIIQLPPMVDKKETKWGITPDKYHDGRIHLIYIGTGSIKDRLDKILMGIKTAGAERFFIDIIGITEEKFQKIYKQNVDSEINVSFHGRMPHLEALKYLMASDFQIFFRDNVRANNAGFPTKYVESMTAGVPVITNRISNIDDYLISGVNSFMIEHPSDKEIADVLCKVSAMTTGEMKTMKRECSKLNFDYHGFLDKISVFMRNI